MMIMLVGAIVLSNIKLHTIQFYATIYEENETEITFLC